MAPTVTEAVEVVRSELEVTKAPKVKLSQKLTEIKVEEMSCIVTCSTVHHKYQ